MKVNNSSSTASDVDSPSPKTKVEQSVQSVEQTGQEHLVEQDSDLGLYSPEVENVSNAAQSMHNRTIGGAAK